MIERKIANRTHFRRREGENGWQWYWTTVAPNGQKTAVGGEGYDELRGVVNGFFSTHGIDITQASLHGEFSPIEKFTDDHYVITQYETQLNTDVSQ